MTPPREEGPRTACCICGNDNASTFLEVSGKSIVRCRACGLVYTADFHQADTLYAGEYFTGPGRYVERDDTFRSLFEPLVEKIRRIKPCGTFLDVGTGVGVLMEVASGKGFAVKGVEVSNWASAYAREKKGLDVVSGRIEDAGFGDASFDVIVLNHVLEHVEAPKFLLAEIRRILKDDGLLVIGVPNAGSLMGALLGARWASWRPDEHIWHFTPATLLTLVKAGGFDVIRWEAKDNSHVTGWGAKDLAQRVINAISVMANKAEAMLLFARKGKRVTT
ncbi:MAG: class I SAM-dependent methyltransferase [Deltaproteobacteria bacterium]|nr:class I SAM-dependent methyltransferase [Deltaproteobacteria bacterium]